MSRSVWKLLALCILLAAALRIWGLDYGVPHPTVRPDEERIVGRAYKILATGEFNPVSYAYPGLMIYLNTLALSAYALVGRLLGYYDNVFGFLFAAVVTHPGLHYVICRSVSVVLGVGTVGITYLLGREGYQSRTVGLVAALCLATNYLHVRDSHFATVDVGMTFFVTLALLYAVKAARHPSWPNYLLAGLFAGASTAAKYNAGLVILGLGAVTALHFFREGDESSIAKGSLLARSLLAVCVMVLAFALFSPYTIIHSAAALKELGGVREFLYGGGTERALWVHLKVTFPQGFGWPFYLAGVAGIVRAVWLRRPTDLVLLAFFVPFFALVSSVSTVFPRYLVPLAPVVAVVAAEFVVSGLARGRRSIVVAAAIALAVPGLWKSIQFDRLISRKDTRVLASEWVAENLPRRSEILICRGYGAPVINEDRRRPPAFEPRTIPCSAKAVRRHEGRFLITHEYHRLWSSPPLRQDLQLLVKESGQPLVRFDPFNVAPTDSPFFYVQDAFYLPFAGLDAVERGGPIITIWEIDREESDEIH
jgi:4-amino-4-deoxy-L-arabinose transferase-like glycosyltransferase